MRVFVGAAVGAELSKVSIAKQRDADSGAAVETVKNAAGVPSLSASSERMLAPSIVLMIVISSRNISG